MNPLVAKVVYMLGYWVANFVIRAPHIKVHQKAPIRSNRNTRLDTSLFIVVGVGGFLVPLLYVFTALLWFADYSIPLWMGVAGIVFGILDRQGRVDVTRSREIIARAGPLSTVFHRAFDFLADQPTALAALADIGCTRVLTSGGQPTALEGVRQIETLIAQAVSRIEVLPGGGIRADNVLQIVQATGCNQIHIGVSYPRDDQSATAFAGIELCDSRFMHGTAYRAVSGDAVLKTKTALRQVPESK